MKRQTIASGPIRSAGYDEERAILEIEFSSGRTYRYFDVPRGTWEWLLRVPSKGRFVNAHVVDVYRFERADGPPEPSDAHLKELLEQSLQRAAPANDDPAR